VSDDLIGRSPEDSGGYLTLAIRIWVSARGKLIRGTIQDVHTGARFGLDLSNLAAFLQACLAHGSREPVAETLEELPENDPSGGETPMF